MAVATPERLAKWREEFSSEKFQKSFAESLRRAKIADRLSDANNEGPFLNPPPNFPYRDEADAKSDLPFLMRYQSRYGGPLVTVHVVRLFIKGRFEQPEEGDPVLVGTAVTAISDVGHAYDWEQLTHA